ncbi:MAG: exosortase/archaeosortase family protein [Anaerolineales bacterium]
MSMDPSLTNTPMRLEQVAKVASLRRSIFRLLLVMTAILLIILPFITTFNEFLTRIVETTGLDALLTDWIVPFEVRMIAVLLGFLGIPSQVTASTIYISKGGLFLPVFISWNCVGWQSFILYGLTLMTGLQGPYTRSSKLEASMVGLLGTFLMNLLRITSVALVAYFFGSVPAVIYHDYGGTILILAWLFFFWWFCHGWLLQPLEQLPEIEIEERFLKEIYAGHAEDDVVAKPKTIRSALIRMRGWLRGKVGR